MRDIALEVTPGIAPRVDWAESLGMGDPGTAFRTAMRHVAGSVAIVATQFRGTRAGLTATAVCSLSAAPPSLLVCVNRQASAHDTLVESGRFCVNFLSEDQEDVARCFGGGSRLRGHERFCSQDWETSENGMPALRGSLASLDCALSGTIRYHTHTILLGDVIGASCREDHMPLIYLKKNYLQIGDLLNRNLFDLNF